MPKQQEGATDRLVSTIQIIQRARGTGVLTARRGKDAAMEEGVMSFTRGQVTEARVGSYTGTKAFNLLSTWENCVFIFVFSDEQDQPLPFLSLSPLSSDDGQSAVKGSLHPSGITPPFVAVSPLRKDAATSRPAGISNSGKEQSPGMASLAAIPRLTEQPAAVLHIFDNMHLSRIHRQICLLVNGQRTIADIMRLAGRSHGEIYGILRDLERASLLWIQDEPTQR